MFLAVGFTTPEVALAQPAIVRGETKRLMEWSITEGAPNLIAAGLTTQEEINQILVGIKALAEDETTVFGISRVTQVWAKK